MTNELKPQDKVRWSSHGGEAVGRVERKITSETHCAGRKVKASPDDPQYLVRSDKSGGEAVHASIGPPGPGASTRRMSASL